MVLGNMAASTSGSNDFANFFDWVGCSDCPFLKIQRIPLKLRHFPLSGGPAKRSGIIDYYEKFTVTEAQKPCSSHPIESPLAIFQNLAFKTIKCIVLVMPPCFRYDRIRRTCTSPLRRLRDDVG